MKGIKTIITFVIITVLIIYYHLLPERCHGIVSVGFLWISLLYITGIILVFVISHNGVKQYRITKNRTALVPVYVVSGLSILIIIVVVGLNIRDSSKILIQAEQTAGAESHSLVLKQNNTFEYSWCHIDFGCTLTGKYKTSRDTVYLSNSIQCDSIMINKLYHKDMFLIPLNPEITINDTSKFFKISK
jgi:hypothetical protein